MRIEGGTLTVNGVLGGPMNVIGGRHQGTGTAGPTTNNAGGTIAPGNSIGTLTVAGDYVGKGGTVEIEAKLSGDSSPADRLVVTGNTSGALNVRLLKVGGSGAQTVEGIKIIDVQGASSGAFSLLGDYAFHGEQAVVGGAYAYTLQKNGISTPADGDWYLRSSLINPPANGPSAPLFQPGAPLYGAYPQVLLGLNGLSTMRQRVEERYNNQSDAFASLGAPADTQGSEVQAWWAAPKAGRRISSRTARPLVRLIKPIMRACRPGLTGF